MSKTKADFSVRFHGKHHEIQAQGMKLVSIEERPGGYAIVTYEDEKRVHIRKRIQFFKQRSRVALQSSTGLWNGDWKNIDHHAGGTASAENDFVAQFPGKVRKIQVSEGALVEAGSNLMLLEAMKMEFAIQTHTKGVVKKLLVKEGDQLTPGQKLLEFEEVKE